MLNTKTMNLKNLLEWRPDPNMNTCQAAGEMYEVTQAMKRLGVTEAEIKNLKAALETELATAKATTPQTEATERIIEHYPVYSMKIDAEIKFGGNGKLIGSGGNTGIGASINPADFSSAELDALNEPVPDLDSDSLGNIDGANNKPARLCTTCGDNPALEDSKQCVNCALRTARANLATASKQSKCLIVSVVILILFVVAVLALSSPIGSGGSSNIRDVQEAHIAQEYGLNEAEQARMAALNDVQLIELNKAIVLFAENGFSTENLDEDSRNMIKYILGEFEAANEE